MTLTPLAKVILVVAVLLIGGVAYFKLRGPGSGKDGSMLGRPLRVGVVTWPGYAGGIVANNGFKPNKDSIYWTKYNQTVEFLLMEDVDARAKAFAKGGAGGVDIVWSTVDFWANELPGFIKNGVNARAIMQVDWSRGGDAVVADNSIRRIEDLPGKKISLTLFTPSHWLLEYNLSHSSLDDSQQTQIVKALVGKNASPDARTDFVANKVDAAVVWEPDVAEALKKRPNSHILVSTAQAKKLIADLMVAREDFIRDNPKVIEAFIRGWILDGTLEANRNPALVAKLLMENEPLYKDLGEQVTKENLPAVKWATLADNTEMFGLDGSSPLFDSIFDEAGKAWVKRGYISAQTASTMSKDVSFLKKIYAETPVKPEQETPQPATQREKTATPITTAQVNIYFPTGVAVLDPNAEQLLDEKVALLPKTYSGAYIRVEGNTDNVGNPISNKILSEKRAKSVVDYLVTKHKLPSNQFIAVGNGSEKPLGGDSSNSTPEGRAKNRRTDVAVVARQ